MSRIGVQLTKTKDITKATATDFVIDTTKFSSLKIEEVLTANCVMSTTGIKTLDIPHSLGYTPVFNTLFIEKYGEFTYGYSIVYTGVMGGMSVKMDSKKATLFTYPPVSSDLPSTTTFFSDSLNVYIMLFAEKLA